MEKWIYILERWQKILWGMPMLVLLLASGALLMVKTRFFLFRKSDLIVRKTIGSLGAKKQQGITSFQAVTTAFSRNFGSWKHCRCCNGNYDGRSRSFILDVCKCVVWNDV